jgi:hypothetical protein
MPQIKKARRKRRTKEEMLSSTSMYINKDTENAVIEYLNPKTPYFKREKIFKNRIQRPFEKLIENVIYNHNFSNLGSYEELKCELMSIIVINLTKFDTKKGSLFSYFNTAVKNYLLNKQKKDRRFVSIDESEHFDKDTAGKTANGDINAFIQDEYNRELRNNEFYKDFITQLKHHIEQKSLESLVQKEKQFYAAILTILESYEDINIHNSKHTHVMIRNLTNLNTKDISTYLRKMKVVYVSFKETYLNEYSNN